MADSQLTLGNLKWLWNFVGGEPGEASVAAAIAYAESGGCQYDLAGPHDIRPVKECRWTVTNGENSCGFWQINLRAHPSYRAPAIFDPFNNARAAVAISNKGRDFGAWSTYTNGAWKKFIGEAASAAPDDPYGDTGAAQGGDTSTGIGQGWATGWNLFRSALGRDVPRGLATCQHYRQATLRHLSTRRRVP